ncbi:putative ABC transporter permease [Peptoniphilus vaginalis]|uniref:putative ABC transporter permease n=1 Tax=Peptoniphilus vaginalis TaxID=1756987 RepID=UPI000A270A7D|nr:putative ABC transporter permease [Peptoniphilus vaginalis]
MKDYLIYFFIYAFIGWVVEVSYHAVTKGKFINRGFLAGPYCPIYGFGAIAVIYFLTDIAEKNKLVLFLGSIFIASLIEFIAGFMLEKIFHERWWDYSDRKLNIGGYICLEFSVIWGMFCFLLFEAVHPIIERLVGLVPETFIKYIGIGLVIIMILDLVASINTLVGLNKEFKAIDKVSRDIKKVSDKIGVKVYDKTVQIESRQEELKKKPEFIEIEKRIKELKERKALLEEKRILKSFPNLSKKLGEKQREIENLRERIRDQFSRT